MSEIHNTILGLMKLKRNIKNSLTFFLKEINKISFHMTYTLFLSQTFQ